MLHFLLSTLLLISLCGPAEGRPPTAHEDTPDVDGEDSQRLLLLEAVKTGILSSLGMDREPRPTEKASHQDLRKMYELYREKLRELRGNSSQPIRESWDSTMSVVLLPATVEPVKVLRSKAGQRIQWYRAVFHKNPKIQTELTLARAELKISRQILDKPTPTQPEIRQEIRVKVNGMKPMNTPAWRHIDTVAHANVSSTQDLTLDISPEVEKWRSDGGQSLVVDVGLVVGRSHEPSANPSVALELGLLQPRRRRQPRSNREDNCDEQGWCCRKSVSVSFKDIGWSDWVVAPTAYTMHFCDGTCPHNYKPASMHTQVKSRLYQMTRGGTPRPCCVPAAYEPMVLMHYDSKGKLKLTPFNDLIVSKCHCA
ncbi:inhibin beta C chain [Centroberyx affinis]|uniref:inhibin beta C chain n=1 Tax=Centroberyx affinis TaxID=166261 RepID=UPI003A5C0F03